MLIPNKYILQVSESNIFCHNAAGTIGSTRMTYNFLVNGL